MRSPNIPRQKEQMLDVPQCLISNYRRVIVTKNMVQHQNKHVNQWTRIEGLSHRSLQLEPATVLTKVPQTDDKMAASSTEGAGKT